MKITDQQYNSVPFKYARGVMDGTIITGKRIRQAVERFYQWIETADQDGYYINHSKGMHIIKFFPEFLTHTVGVKSGQPFELSPYQQFTLYNIFGWVRKTEKGKEIRRIRNVYEKIAKKNGKTAVMAGVGLYCMSFDGESGAQIYVGATKEEQAKICFEQAEQFINKSEKLRTIGFKSYQKHIQFNLLNSKLRPLGGDSKTQDGINTHLAIIDEYHAHADDSVKENLESSMAARIQPLIYHITTAGFNTSSVCKNYERMCETVLDGILIDDSLFIMMHDIDEGDDWESVETWKKSNPNLGESVTLDFLNGEYQKVLNQPSKSPNFKTKHLNMWVDAPSVWISDEVWMKCNSPVVLENFKKNGSILAIDLSSRTDITAEIYLSEPDEEGIRDVLPFFYCPKETVDKRSKEDRVPYRYWVESGYMTATDGNVIDYTEIFNHVVQNKTILGMKNVELDQWNAQQMANNFQEVGIDYHFFSQAISVISEPTKQFQTLVLSGKIRHGGNPVLRWMLSGCVVIQDPNENIKVHKGKSHMGKKRVDGIIATIMALGGSMSTKIDSNESAYNDPNNEFVVY